MSVSLKNYNTFGIDASCRLLIPIRNENELENFLSRSEDDFKILGGGSNVLLTSNLDCTILKNEIKGIEDKEIENGKRLISVGSGEIWHDFVMWTVSKNYCGLENLAYIPGTVGAAPIQNIGAYGIEQNNCFHSLRAIDLNSGQPRIFTAHECKFGYRDSIFKNAAKDNYFITQVNYVLSNNTNLNTSYKDIQNKIASKNIKLTTAKQLADIIVEIRKEKLPDPAEIGNGGSFFKNPIIDKRQFEDIQKKYPNIPFYPTENIKKVKIPAAWLIDQSGFKGITVGKTGTHERQALVIVNRSDATGEEIVNFSKTIQAKVLANFAISLEPEINFW